MGVRIVPFERKHSEAAARLLAERHARSRTAEPALAACYEDPSETTVELEKLASATRAAGAVALAGTELVGFVLGVPREDPTWGPNMWVESAGHAVVEPEIVRDLYAAAAQGWVDDALTHHYAVVPADDRELVDAWFHLGFGLQHVHALGRDDRVSFDEPPRGVTIRRATRDDIRELARIDLLLPAHHRCSPVFSEGPPMVFEELVTEWESDIDDARYATFVAEVEGAVVGSAIICPFEVSKAHTGLAAVDGAAYLGFAALDAEWRGRGLGTALYDRRIQEARARGYEVLVTDFRAANLLSSRFYRRRGFRETFLRLFRHV